MPNFLADQLGGNARKANACPFDLFAAIHTVKRIQFSTHLLHRNDLHSHVHDIGVTNIFDIEATQSTTFMAPCIQVPTTAIERQTHGAHDTTRFFTLVIREVHQANTLTTNKTLTDHVKILARDGLALRHRDLHALQ